MSCPGMCQTGCCNILAPLLCSLRHLDAAVQSLCPGGCLRSLSTVHCRRLGFALRLYGPELKGSITYSCMQFLAPYDTGVQNLGIPCEAEGEIQSAPIY